jgi:predicted MPP superfamily phosphohydrolase
MVLKNNLFLLFLLNFFLSNSYAQDQLNKEQHNKDLKILLISDLNDSYGSVTYSNEVHDIINKIEVIKPDIVLCGGDMVAGQKKSLTVQQLDRMWNGFQSTVLDPLLMIVIFHIIFPI